MSKYWRQLSLKSWSTVRELDFRDTLSGLPKAMLSSMSVLSILERTRDNDIQTFRVPSHYRLNVDLNVFLGKYVNMFRPSVKGYTVTFVRGNEFCFSDLIIIELQN